MRQEKFQSGPSGGFFTGNLAEFRSDPIGAMRRWQRDWGNMVPFRMGPRRFFLVSHPDLAEDVLVRHADRFVKVYDPARPIGLALVLGQGLLTSRGDLWRRQRKLLQPGFSRRSVACMADTMVAVAERTAEDWKRMPPGATVDVADAMMRLTLEIITRSLFGTSVLDNVTELSPAIETLLHFAFRTMQNPLQPPLWLPTPENRAFRRALAVVDRQVFAIIGERRASGRTRGDLLDTLLEARNADTGEAMLDRQLRDEVVTLFMAGHETTANALAWCWYLLDRHPRAAQAMRDELDAVLGARRVRSGDYGALEYTRAVFREAIRLYPPAPMVVRRAASGVDLGGVPVRRGDFLAVSIFNIHRHPEFWDEAERFEPLRFVPTLQNARHRSAYLPFGLGQRSCIGNHFAVMEGVMVLATLARRFRLNCRDDAVEAELAVTLRPRNGLYMHVHRAGEPAGEGCGEGGAA